MVPKFPLTRLRLTRLFPRLLLAVLALGVGLATQLIFLPGQTSRLDELLRDQFVRRLASDQVESRITVIDIDETSLRELGPWPWPRSRLADLIEILLGPLQAKAVALDMVLPEAADTLGDQRLASLARYAPFTLGVAFDYVPRHPALMQGEPGRGRPSPFHATPVPATGYVGNHPGLGADACTGNIGFVPDSDGAIRRLPLVTRLARQTYLPLAISLLACSDARALATERLAGLDDTHGYWRIPFPRALSAFTVVSASAVLNESVPRELVSGRYVLIGSSALGLADRVATPLDPSTSGVMVHASALSALLSGGDTAAHPPAWTAYAVSAAWTLLTVIAALLFLSRLAPHLAVGLLGGAAAGWLLLAWYLTSLGLEFSITAPLAAYSAILITALPYEWIMARRESGRMQRMLSHYVSPEVLDELLRQRDEQPLEPRFCNITVLVADMEGYTRATSSLSLDAAAELTKSFLDALTEPIIAAGGTLDKYTGDGLVAFWGAPLNCPDRADRAIDVAHLLIAAVEALAVRRSNAGLLPVKVRIGIESGTALVGDLGTPFRSTYTAVGDCINFAARLQEAARNLPVNVVIGPETQRQCVRNELKLIGQHRLRDTDQTIEIFTL